MGLRASWLAQLGFFGMTAIVCACGDLTIQPIPEAGAPDATGGGDDASFEAGSTSSTSSSSSGGASSGGVDGSAPDGSMGDAGGDAAVDGGADCSSKKSCYTTDMTCRSACDATSTTCSSACPKGNPGDACRTTCTDNHTACLANCTKSCNTCAGVACAAACP